MAQNNHKTRIRMVSPTGEVQQTFSIPTTETMDSDLPEISLPSRPGNRLRPCWERATLVFILIGSMLVAIVVTHLVVVKATKSQPNKVTGNVLNVTDNQTEQVFVFPSELTSIPFSQSTETPSMAPFRSPTISPSSSPSSTSAPSSVPTTKPTFGPSSSPSVGPTQLPTELPSSKPTPSPSKYHSSMPTQSPTTSPSFKPSSTPTTSPSFKPSSTPSISPSLSPSYPPAYFDPNPVPRNPPRGYFNYDLNDKTYGPRSWHRIDTSEHPLKEFGKKGWGPWKGHLPGDPTENLCGRADRRQSPKNLHRTMDCEAHHEIRTWCGSYGLGDDEFETQILPHKLSLKMNRRKCLNVERSACEKPYPPIADYPKYTSTTTAYSDAITYDIKVPGEHTIEGVAFDAEIQILHVHPIDERASSIGVPIRVSDDGGHNTDFQILLNHFQNLYADHAQDCRRLRQRHLRQALNMDVSFFEDTPARETQEPTERFDPYSDALMPTIFFYRYDGSITEPPCKDITWWVMSEPAIISPKQLAQLKRILFSHVDSNCNPTSVHNRQESVARPIYPRDGREIQACTSGDFISDFDKGRGKGKKCRE